jgi:hypothetical protein
MRIPFINVVGDLSIAVVVEINLHQQLWVAAETRDRLEECRPLLERGILEFEHGQKDFLEKHFNLLLHKYKRDNGRDTLR